MNEDNLIPMNKLTEDEQRELARKGGLASAEARRRKKTMREWAEVLGEFPMTLKMPDGSEKGGDINAAVVLKQMVKAVNKGDTNAAAFLMRLRGEDVQKHEYVDDAETKRAVAEALRDVYGIETEGGKDEAKQD